jgi:hypothetical protein
MGATVESFSGGIKSGQDEILTGYKKISVEKRKNNLTRKQPVRNYDITVKRVNLALDDFKNSSRYICETLVSTVFSKVKMSGKDLLILMDIVVCVYLISKLDENSDAEYIESLNKRLNQYLKEEVFESFLLKLNSIESSNMDKIGIETVVVDSESLKPDTIKPKSKKKG